MKGEVVPKCDTEGGKEVSQLKIVSWNIRGANDGSKRKVVKVLLRSQRAAVVCIQENKLQCMLISFSGV